MIDRDILTQSVAAFEDAGRNLTQAAFKLGIARSTLTNRLRLAAQVGIIEYEGRVPPGFVIQKITVHADKDGELQQTWSHLKPEGQSYEDILLAVEEALEDRVPAVPIVPEPLSLEHYRINPDLLTLYPIIDHHLGLYAWEPETGSNYDLNIAAKILKEALRELIESSPPSEHAILLNIGDFFHSDDNSNRTRRSGNVLDADGRYAKTLELGVDLLIYGGELALSKHSYVEMRNMPGNHDEYASLALNTSLRMAFRDNPRIHVSRDPSHFYFKQHGKTMIAATHGDFTKPKQLPGVMAAYAPKMWGDTEYRYGLQGHIHHDSKGEENGAVWETFRTLAAKDAWATNSGYAAGRGMVSITYHKESGEKYRHIHNISGPGFKKGL